MSFQRKRSFNQISQDEPVGSYARGLMAGQLAPWANRRVRGKTTRKFGGRKDARSKNPAVALIKRTVIAMNEKKTISYENTADIVGYNYASTFLRLPITPSSTLLAISQGTGQGDRTGNRIRVHKATLKLIVNPYPYDVVTNAEPCPGDFRLLIVKNKGLVNSSQPTASTFFQNGDTVLPPSGILADMLYDVNKDVMTVYKDTKWKCGTHYYQAGAYSTVAYSLSANNDYKYNVMREIDITKYVPTIIDYPDTSTQPTSDSVWMCILLADANNTSNTESKPFNLTYLISYEFTDA